MNNRNVLITILEAGESRCLHGPVVQRALVSLVCSLCLLAESSHGQGGKLHLWDLCYNLNHEGSALAFASPPTGSTSECHCLRGKNFSMQI